jgi:hypothetical protein
VRCDRSSSCREGAGKGFEAEGEGEGGIACWPEGETEKQEHRVIYNAHTTVLAMRVKFPRGSCLGPPSQVSKGSACLGPSSRVSKRSSCLGPSSRVSNGPIMEPHLGSNHLGALTTMHDGANAKQSAWP